jgi:ribosomal protein S18 acetylase RimI-like enzyme
MGIAKFVSRFRDFYRRHGLVSTASRIGLALKRGLFSNRMIVFYCDLSQLPRDSVGIPDSLKIGHHSAETELSPKDFQAMTSFWNPKQARRNISERFKQGASLWLIKSENELAGYGWSLQGRTVEPYYFPLGNDDFHLFDFHVFPQYRGRRINPLLVTLILHNMAVKCRGRAFIEAAEWNEAQLASLRKTAFRHLGLVRSFTLFGHKFVSWVGNITLKQPKEDLDRKDVAATAGRPPAE